MATVKPPQVKKTQTTETVFGMAAANLKKAAQELKAGFEQIDGLTGKAEELEAVISNKQSEIEEITIQIGEKKRQAIVQIDLDLKEYKQDAAKRMLAQQGLEVISQDELSKLREENIKLKTDFDGNVAQKVAIATNSMKRDHESDMKLKEAQWAATDAQSKAQLSTLNDKIVFLQEQNTKWEDALNSERQASIERAKASQIQNLNVGGNNGK